MSQPLQDLSYLWTLPRTDGVYSTEAVAGVIEQFGYKVRSPALFRTAEHNLYNVSLVIEKRVLSKFGAWISKNLEHEHVATLKWQEGKWFFSYLFHPKPEDVKKLSDIEKTLEAFFNIELAEPERPGSGLNNG